MRAASRRRHADGGVQGAVDKVQARAVARDGERGPQQHVGDGERGPLLHHEARIAPASAAQLALQDKPPIGARRSGKMGGER